MEERRLRPESAEESDDDAFKKLMAGD